MLNIIPNLDALLTRACHCYADDDLDQAHSLAQQVLQLQPEHPRTLHLLGAIAIARNLPEPALALLNRALVQQPDSAAIHCDLAIALEALRRLPEAITHLRLALALQPDLSLARTHLHQILSAQGLADPASLPPEPAYIQTLNHLAARAAYQGNPALAIRLYEHSLTASPDQPAILAAVGKLYLQTRESRSAIDAFRSAIRLQHRSAETFHDLARALRRHAFFEDALAAAQSAAQLDPADMDLQWTITGILADIHTRDRQIAQLRGLAADPANEDLKFQLAALTEDVDLSSFPLARVADLFNQYAQGFETHLTGRLHYRGHQQIFDAVTSVAPNRRFDILDLGCGTGLCGLQFKPLANYLKGIDLAPAMIDQARGRAIYDDLEATDLVTALYQDLNRCDLILAADVFVYVGNLDPAFAAASAALRPGGLFAFSAQSTDRPGFVFTRLNSCFAHSLSYLQDLARRYGFTQLYAKEHPLRVEGRTPLAAWIVVLQK